MTRAHAPVTLAAIVSALVLTVAAVDAAACSMTIDYLKPTNYELVQAAERIVLARAIGTEGKCRTRFAVERTVKGAAIPGELVLEGCSRGPALAVQPLADAEDDFSEVRGSAGSCVRATYEQEFEYVLLLQPYRDGWTSLRMAFARVNEPVAGPDSAWVRAVTRYAEVAALADYDARNVALRALQARARAGDDPTVPRALVGDIDRHFATPTNAKSHADLLALYEASADDQTRTAVLWAWATRGAPEARPQFQALLDSGQTVGPVAAYFSKIRDTGSLDRFADAYVAAEKDDWWGRTSPLRALLDLADEERVDVVVRAYTVAVSAEEVRWIEQWFAAHPTEVGRQVLRDRVASRYVDKYDGAFALAAAGDADVVDWAIRFAAQPGKDQWVALYVLAHSPLESADRAVRSLIAASDKRLVQVVQGYANAVNPNASSRLREIVALPDKSAELDGWLLRTIESLRQTGRLPDADVLLTALPPDAAEYFGDE